MYGHVGRPTNEEVSMRRRKQLLKVLLPCGLIIVAICIIVGRNGLNGLMGASVSYGCSQKCPDGWTIDKQNSEVCYQESNELHVLGDTDGDNEFTSKDYSVISKVIDSKDNLDDIKKIIYDINGDREVNKEDLSFFDTSSSSKQIDDNSLIKCPDNRTETIEKDGQKQIISAEYSLSADDQKCSVSITIRKEIASEKVCHDGRVGSSSPETTNQATTQATEKTNAFADKLHVVNYTSGTGMILESNGHYGVIDTGPNSKKMMTAIKNIIKNNNISTEDFVLDFVIITHAHLDHMGGAADIIKKYKPKKLYIKKFSFTHEGVTEKQINDMKNIGDKYKETVLVAADNGVTIIEYGVSQLNKEKFDTEKYLHDYCSENDKCHNYSYDGSNSTKNRDFTLGNFTIRLYNLYNQLEALKPGSHGEKTAASENLNSFVILLSKELSNGKIVNTYLGGDMMYSNHLRSNKQVKDIILNQVLRDLKGNEWPTNRTKTQDEKRAHVFQMSHHGKFNSDTIGNFEKLTPDYIFAPASQAELLSKTQVTYKCPINGAKKYLNERKLRHLSFENNFRLAAGSGKSSPLVIEYTYNGVKMSGGYTWDETMSVDLYNKNGTKKDSHSGKLNDNYWSSADCASEKTYKADEE